MTFQNIPTHSATTFNFFKILQEPFLAVTNVAKDSNSVIYKWNDNQFELFQETGIEGGHASTAFLIKNETFIVFANNHNSQQGYAVHSTVFKWSGNSFVELQSLQTYAAADVKSFNINGDPFLAFANERITNEVYNINSSIYKWDGSKFVLFQSIPTRGALKWHPFVMCGQTFLAVANCEDDSQGVNTKSVIYPYAEQQFIQYQEISTQGASDMTSFEYNGHTYLAVVNFKNNNGKHNINSTLYEWI